MLVSLSLILIFGLIFSSISRKLKLPGLIGMLFAGLLLGPFGLNLIDGKILKISTELRQIALIIILIKAGLTLSLKDLKKSGKSAILLSFLPASFEIIAYGIFSNILLGLDLSNSLLLGSVIAAVSPAVVVPRMVRLIEEKKGTKKAIPQMILAGASCDDVFVLVLFSSFLSMAGGSVFNIRSLLNVPISIVLGLVIGGFVGYILHCIFEYLYNKNNYIRNSVKLIIILALAFMLVSLEDYFTISGLLAVIAMALIIRYKSDRKVYQRLSDKFAKLWIFAEIFLFVLVGAEIDISYIGKIGFIGPILIILCLISRSLGTLFSLKGSNFNKKEKIFITISYMPKATVQAAIGALPLSLGFESGDIILSMAVLSIVMTAPLGALFIDNFSDNFLD